MADDTTTAAQDAAPKKPKKAPADTTTAAPAQVVLAAPFGYYDDAGVLQFWQPGFTETDAAKVADLIARGAPLEAVNV